MTRSFRILLILMMMLMVVVMMLTVLSSKGWLGASPLIQVSNSNVTPDFITPNTANRYRYVVLYAALVKFHLTVAISMDCVNLVRGKRVQSNKKGAAASTSRPILYMRTVSSTVPICGILKTNM